MKWLALLLAPLAGAALMLAMGYAIAIVVPTSFLVEWYSSFLLVIGILGYFTAGFIAGFWINWKGVMYGGLAGLFLWILNLFISLYVNPLYSLVSNFILLYYLIGIGCWIVGAIGGLVGEKVRDMF